MARGGAGRVGDLGDGRFSACDRFCDHDGAFREGPERGHVVAANRNEGFMPSSP